MTYRYPFSAIHPSDHYGQCVAVYFNLHYKVFSIKESKNGNLISHAGACLLSDAVFDISPKGRERSIREGRRRVHAYAIGVLKYLSWDLLSPAPVESLLETGWQQITYDLHPDHPEFYLKNYNCYVPVKQAKSVILSNKIAWVLLS
jgi:hypothetical protein